MTSRRTIWSMAIGCGLSVANSLPAEHHLHAHIFLWRRDRFVRRIAGMEPLGMDRSLRGRLGVPDDRTGCLSRHKARPDAAGRGPFDKPRRCTLIVRKLQSQLLDLLVRLMKPAIDFAREVQPAFLPQLVDSPAKLDQFAPGGGPALQDPMGVDRELPHPSGEFRRVEASSSIFLQHRRSLPLWIWLCAVFPRQDTSPGL